jgi:hypothetical protein
VCEQCRLTLCDCPQPMFRPPAMPLQPSVLPHCPPNQGEVEVSEDRIQRGLVVAAEVPNPASDHGIEHVRQVSQVLVGTTW